MQTLLYKKLLELIRKMNIELEMEKIFGKDYKRELLKLSDEEVKEILSLEDSKLFVAQMYLFLNKDRIPKEIYITLNFKLIEKNTNIYELISLLGNDEFLKRKDAYSIIDKMVHGESVSYDAINELIFNPDITFPLVVLETIASCKQKYQADALKDLAIKFNGGENILNILQIISTSKGEKQAEKACEFVLNFDVLNKNNRLVMAFLQAISNAEYDYQAENAYLAATSESILNHKDNVRIVKLISKTIGKEKCGKVKEVALNENILKYSNAIKFIEAVSEADEKIFSYVADAAIKLCVFREKSLLTIITIIAKAKGEKQAEKALELISDEKFLQRYDIIPVLTLIVNSEAKDQVENAAAVAKTLEVAKLEDYIKLVLNASTSKKSSLIRSLLENKEFLDNSHHFKILEKISKAKTDEIAQKTYNLITNPLVLKRNDLFDIVNVIASVSFDFQAYFISNSINEELFELPNYLRILEMVGNSKGNTQADIACKIANNYLFVQSNKHLEYISLFAQASNNSLYLQTIYSLCTIILEENPDILDNIGINYVRELLSLDMSKINQINQLCSNSNFKGKKLLEEIVKIIDLENREEVVEIVPLESILEGSIDEVIASLDSLSNDEDINPKTFVLKQRKDDC